MVIAQHWNVAGLEHHAFGLFGVRLFFVLSGFLITGILLDGRDAIERGASFGHELRTFYIRRSLRIFPVYYLVLAITALLGFPFIVDWFGWHALYGTNILLSINGHWMGTGSHLWSLAVEEQFYLLWPALLLAVSRRAVLPLIIGVIFSASIWRWSIMGMGLPHIASFTMVFGCLDALGLGALLAYASRQGWDTRRWTLPMLVAGIPLLWLDDDIGRPMIAGAIVNYILVNRGTALLAPLRLAPITYIGTISYGLYLYHPFVQMAVGPLLPKMDTKLQILAYSIATLLVTVTSWELFEKPVNGLKRLFPYNRKPTGPLAAA